MTLRTNLPHRRRRNRSLAPSVSSPRSRAARSPRAFPRLDLARGRINGNPIDLCRSIEVEAHSTQTIQRRAETGRAFFLSTGRTSLSECPLGSCSFSGTGAYVFYLLLKAKGGTHDDASACHPFRRPLADEPMTETTWYSTSRTFPPLGWIYQDDAD